MRGFSAVLVIVSQEKEREKNKLFFPKQYFSRRTDTLRMNVTKMFMACFVVKKAIQFFFILFVIGIILISQTISSIKIRIKKGGSGGEENFSWVLQYVSVGCLVEIWIK